MLHGTAFRLRQPHIPQDHVLHNALIESFLLHFRLLAEFLCSSNASHKDTIVAAHFLGHPPVGKGTVIDTHRNACHTWLAHLSRNRDLANKPEWLYPSLYHEIHTALLAFIHDCGSNQADPIATELLNKLRELPSTIS
jgi:hypothetical protein